MTPDPETPAIAADKIEPARPQPGHPLRVDLEQIESDIRAARTGGDQ